MVHVIIEGKRLELEVDASKSLTWQRFVDELEDLLLSVGKVPTGIKINAKNYSEQDFQAIKDDYLSGDETIELTVVSLHDFLIQTFDEVAIANQSLVQNLRKFAESIGKGESLSDTPVAIAELRSFFGFWSKVKALLPPDLASIHFQEEPIEEFLKRLQSLAKDIVESMEGQDYALAADLMLYELVPAIESVGDVIPGIVKVLRDQKKKLVQ